MKDIMKKHFSVIKEMHKKLAEEARDVEVKDVKHLGLVSAKIVMTDLWEHPHYLILAQPDSGYVSVHKFKCDYPKSWVDLRTSCVGEDAVRAVSQWIRITNGALDEFPEALFDDFRGIEDMDFSVKE